MNELKVMNEAVFRDLCQFIPEYKEMTFVDNVISYKGSSILLKNFAFDEYAKYSKPLLVDLAADELFDILYLHVTTFSKIMNNVDLEKTSVLEPIIIGGKPKDKEINNADCISLNRFSTLVRKNESLSLNELKELNAFFEVCEQLIIYEDYLTPEIRNNLNTIRSVLLDFVPTLEDKSNYEYLMKKWDMINKNAIIRKKKIIEEIETRNAGFVNSFLLATIVSFTGVFLALLVMVIAK